MADVETVMKAVECRANNIVQKCDGCFYKFENTERGCNIHKILSDALELLKEQQQKIWEYQELTEYLRDKQPQIVRCKDCRFWNKTIYDTPKWVPCMSVQTSGNWFCADGVAKDINVPDKEGSVK